VNFLFSVEMKSGDSFEAFLQVRLDLFWLLRFRQNFKKLIIRQEVEAGECTALLL